MLRTTFFQYFTRCFYYISESIYVNPHGLSVSVIVNFEPKCLSQLVPLGVWMANEDISPEAWSRHF